MLERVKATIKKHSMLASGDKVLAGVSGGPDSVALVHVLKTISKEYDITVFVAHLNHCFRGRDSAEDADFVRKLSAELGLESFVESRDVTRFLTESNLSTQAGARLVRYEFFKKAAAYFGCNKLATGHNANDQAETVLNNFLRGSGPTGLAGIPPIRNGEVIRPLIEVTRSEIENYCADNNLCYRTDKSNLKKVYTRNRIRLELIPYLEKEYNNNLVETLVRTSEIFREEEHFIQAETLKYWETVIKDEKPAKLQFNIEPFRELPTVIQKRIIRQAWEKLTGAIFNLNFVHLANIIDFVNNARTGSVFNLPKGMTLVKSYGCFSMSEALPHALDVEYSYEVRVPGETHIPETGQILLAQITKESMTDSQKGPDEINIDLNLVKLPLTVRSRRPGDWFRPFGFDGSKKLKKFFIDGKIPRDLRERYPIVTSADGNIVWVAGLKADRRWLATPDTKQFLRLKLV